MDWYAWAKDIIIPAAVGVGTLTLAFVSFRISRASHDTANQSLAVASAANEAAERYHAQMIETETREDRRRVAAAVRAWYESAGYAQMVHAEPPTEESEKRYSEARIAVLEMDDTTLNWYFQYLRDGLGDLALTKMDVEGIYAQGLEIHRALLPIMRWITNPNSLESYRRYVLDHDIHRPETPAARLD